MKVLDPGHCYSLNILDGSPTSAKEYLTFVKREGPKYPGNTGHNHGTNIQEVLRVIIDRITYLNSQIPDDRNEQIIYKLRDSLYLLEKRAADRHGRNFDGILTCKIEDYPTCLKCGHIGCKGTCH